jgi:uncharacterized peroxidase-related enzyme
MPFFKSYPEDANPGTVFEAYPEIYEPWAHMGQALINGPSPLTPAEREMIQAYVAGIADCQFGYIAHAEIAYASGIKRGLIEKLVSDLDTAPIDDKFKPLMAYVRELTLAPSSIRHADAEAVFAAGWDEKALHDTIAVTARMNFMCRIVQGFGFTPWDQAHAKEHAGKRLKLGYVNLFPALNKTMP